MKAILAQGFAGPAAVRPVQNVFRRLWTAAVLIAMTTFFASDGFAAPGRVEIIAHRGASKDAPENTLSAFKLGYEQQADAVELDVHLTKDRRIVAIHDSDTGRVGGITNQVAEQTFDALRRLDVGAWGPWKGKGFEERIPSLEEVLAIVPSGRRLVIEIKCGPEIVPELQRVLRISNIGRQQVVIIGFDLETVTHAKSVFPEIPVLWLVQGDRKARTYPPIHELIQKAKEAKLDGLNLEKGFPLTVASVKEIHGAGLKVYTWTVDDLALARRWVEIGVDGITSNRPGWLREQLGL